MSDFEDKLRSLPFREPPRDLRRRVLAAAEDAASRPSGPSWRDWFWPAPVAWAALVAILAVVFAIDAAMSPPPPQNPASFAAAPAPFVLYAFQARQAMLPESPF